MEASKEKGEYLNGKFMKLKDKYPIKGDMRGLGLKIGVDMVKDLMTKDRNQRACTKICYRCYEKGLVLTFFANNVLRVSLHL